MLQHRHRSRSSSVRTCHGLCDTRNLETGANYASARRVVDREYVLVLGLRALPDLDFTTAEENTHTL